MHFSILHQMLKRDPFSTSAKSSFGPQKVRRTKRSDKKQRNIMESFITLMYLFFALLGRRTQSVNCHVRLKLVRWQLNIIGLVWTQTTTIPVRGGIQHNYDLHGQPLRPCSYYMEVCSLHQPFTSFQSSSFLCNELDFSHDPFSSIFYRFVLSDLIFNQRRPIWSRAERFANYHRDPFHFAKSKP